MHLVGVACSRTEATAGHRCFGSAVGSCCQIVYLEDARPIEDGCAELRLSAPRCTALIEEARAQLRGCESSAGGFS